MHGIKCLINKNDFTLTHINEPMMVAYPNFVKRNFIAKIKTDCLLHIYFTKYLFKRSDISPLLY